MHVCLTLALDERVMSSAWSEQKEIKPDKEIEPIKARQKAIFPTAEVRK